MKRLWKKKMEFGEALSEGCVSLLERPSRVTEESGEQKKFEKEKKMRVQKVKKELRKTFH